jgi:hypothetical protein
MIPAKVSVFLYFDIFSLLGPVVYTDPPSIMRMLFVWNGLNFDRQQLDRAQTRTQNGGWPENTEITACHHLQ